MIKIDLGNDRQKYRIEEIEEKPRSSPTGAFTVLIWTELPELNSDLKESEFAI